MLAAKQTSEKVMKEELKLKPISVSNPVQLAVREGGSGGTRTVGPTMCLFIFLFQTNDKGRLAPLTCHEYGTSNTLKSRNSKNTNEKNDIKIHRHTKYTIQRLVKQASLGVK